MVRCPFQAGKGRAAAPARADGHVRSRHGASNLMTEATKGKRIHLGRSPLAVTPLGVGCWAWGDQRFWRYGEDLGPRDVVDAFDACLHAGLDFYDTAEAYGAGKSEQFVGSLARRSGRELVIAKKYAPTAG